MIRQDKNVYKILDSWIKQNRSFALWRIPGESPCYVMQTSGSARIFHQLEELDEQKGFVIAPFHISKQHPIVLIRPDVCEPLTAEQITERQKFLVNEAEPKGERSTTSVKGWGTQFLNEQQRKADYHKRFQTFIDPLQQKKFDKLVLSRRYAIPTPSAYFSPTAAFYKAIDRYIYSYVYLFHTPETGTWLGCTPEIILSGEKGEWHTVALAGTQPLHEGKLPTAWDEKNRKEQEYVALYIRKQLKALGITPTETAPASVQAGELSHLKSSFTFPLSNNQKLGDLLKRLHPTPAVCGLPKEEAYCFIHEQEGYDRSYYSGFIGLLDPTKRSDLYVNLRCMNILPEAFVLYAGGGILASSEIESEWAETEAKMQTIKRLIEDKQTE